MSEPKTPKKRKQRVPRGEKTLSPARRAHREDGERTRARVFSAALGLFRKQGFDAATMRDIAKAAGLSLGAAYHYFPGKHAIVTELFGEHIERHELAARGAMARATDLRGRLEAVLATGIEVRAPDRTALVAISRVVLDPEDPASLFSPDMAGFRDRSIAIFREAVEVDEVPPDVREMAGRALWAVHLGLLLVFIRDPSPNAQDTLAIVRQTADVLPSLLVLGSQPALAPFRGQLGALLSAAAAVGSRPRA